MNPKIQLPLFLQSEKVAGLNDSLIQKTGCFAFLKTDQVLFSTMPESWQDAFSVVVVGLYAVYHDFGCKYLRLILDNKLCPATMPSAVKEIRHLDDISTFRANIAHGILPLTQRISCQKLFYDWNCFPPVETHISYNQWPDYLNALTEDDWAKIVTRITDDSNQLFHYLEQWADTWAGDSSKLIWLRKEFGEDDRFSHSIDSRICKPILDANGVSNRRIKGYLRQNSQELNQWRDQLKSYFLNGSISSPQDLYQELERIIHSFVTPIPMSSSNIASQFGFGIPSS